MIKPLRHYVLVSVIETFPVHHYMKCKIEDVGFHASAFKPGDIVYVSDNPSGYQLKPIDGDDTQYWVCSSYDIFATET